jgi:hypothetical protein
VLLGFAIEEAIVFEDVDAAERKADGLICVDVDFGAEAANNNRPNRFGKGASAGSL